MISISRGTIGVRLMPDDRDSGRCHLNCGEEGVVRINLDGIWTVLCKPHRAELVRALNKPEPRPRHVIAEEQRRF